MRISVAAWIAVISGVVFVLTSRPIGAQADGTELKPGSAVEGELKPSQARSYRIRAAADQFLHVIADLEGMEARASLFDPDGALIEESFSQNGNRGPEQVTVIIGTAGDYRLELRSQDDNSQTGRYRARIEVLRTATAEDRSRVAARWVFEEAQHLRVESKAESLRTSIRKYQDALPLWRAAADRRMEAITLNNIGLVYSTLDERHKALAFYEESLPMLRALNDRRGEAVTLHNLGDSYHHLGDPQKALDCYRQALSLWRSLADDYGQAYTLLNLGALYLALGEPPKALDLLNQALPLARAAGSQGPEASILNQIGASYQALGTLPKSLEYLEKALGLYRQQEDSRRAAGVLSSMGEIHRLMGQPRKALEYHDQALPVQRAAGDRGGEAATLDYMGAAYSSLGDLEKAMGFHSEALAVRRDIQDRIGEAATLANLARAERQRGNLEAARGRIEGALEIVESLRAEVASQDLRAAYLAAHRSYYEFSVDLLMRMHRDRPADGLAATALLASERGRARVLVELLHEAHADIRQGIDAPLLESEREIQQRLNARAERLTRLLGGGHPKDEADQARQELDGVLTEYLEIEARIRSQSPRYAALTRPQPLGLREIQSQVTDADTALLEYALGDERSYLWVVTPASLASFELPKRVEIEAAARRLHGMLALGDKIELRSRTRMEAAELGKLLLAPAAAQLRNKRLMVVADGVLQYVPFAALPDPGDPDSRPLVAGHEFVSLPSASMLAELRREAGNRKPADREVAVLADPVVDSRDPRLTRAGMLSEQTGTRAAADLMRSANESGGAAFERLRFTRGEAEAIASLARPDRSLKALDFDASRATATGAEVGRYRILHFATHAVINSLHPELSGIVLSMFDRQGMPQDGFLRLHDIYNLRLAADMVVLSACQTALGPEVKGEGLIGLTRGFMYAGAQRVVASLWNVRDDATAELMKRFYEAMFRRGLRPAAALRAAQVSMSQEKRWEAPYYWAGFVLQGDWK